MAEWKKIITSGSTAELNNLSASGNVVPTTTDGGSLGTTTLNWSDLFLDSGGVINFDSGDVTLTHAAGKLTFGGDGAVELDFNNHEMTNVDIDSGAIDGTNITVGSGKTLDVSGGTLTLAADQISGDAINGGTIGSITISQLAGALDANNVAITNVDIDSGAIDGTDITVGTGKTLDVSGGTLTLANDQISGNAINGGTIGSTTITTLTGTTITGTTIKDFTTISSSEAGTGSFGELEVASTGSFGHINLAQGGAVSGAFYGDGSGLTGVGTDIDTLTELDATPHATQDEFLISDNGTEKRISMTNVAKGVFAVASDSDDATIGADGGITINADSVEGTMLNDNVADDSTIEVSSNNLSVLKVPNALTADDTTIQLDSGTTYDGSGAKTISAKTAAIANGGTALATADQIHTFYTAGGADLATALNTDLGGNFTIGTQADDTATFSGPVVISGDLTINGTTTTISSSNTEVRDQFLFLNSGSNTGDGGIIVQNDAHNSGSAFLFDNSEDRWGFATGSVGKTDTTVTPSAYASAVVENDNVSEYRKNGNIRVQGGEIYIYVE